jgi:hypothetical protein
MQDSSDEESEYAKFVSRLEEDLPTPMRNLLDENTVKNDESSAITSTPLKDSVLISQMPSKFMILIVSAVVQRNHVLYRTPI